MLTWKNVAMYLPPLDKCGSRMFIKPKIISEFSFFFFKLWIAFTCIPFEKILLVYAFCVNTASLTMWILFVSGLSFLCSRIKLWVQKGISNYPVYHLTLMRMNKEFEFSNNLGPFLTFRVFFCCVDLIWALNVFVCCLCHKDRSEGPKVRFSNHFKYQSSGIAVKDIGLVDISP